MILGFLHPMKLWPYISFILLAPQLALFGQSVAVLEEKGNDALVNGLWEVAESRFRECLAAPSLSPDEKSQVALRLVESLIRANKTVEALELLNLSFVAKNPESLFWKAQAVSASGRFAEAVGIFSQFLAAPIASYRAEAGFSKASLEISLGKSDSALDTLAAFMGDPNLRTSATAKLLAMEILLDQNRPAEARKIMQEKDSVPVSERSLANYLEARLFFTEGRFSDAGNAFQLLVSQPQGQSLLRYHAAAIGLADTLTAQGNQEDAAKFLLTFIQEHPDSPTLDAMFKRLQQWLPATPNATDPILEQLAQWITPAELPARATLGETDSAVAPAWPRSSAGNKTDLLTFAIFTRAVGVHRIGTPESKAEAFRLMTRLRLENPDHILANRALFQMARWQLDEGANDSAFALLETLKSTEKSPLLRGEAAFIQARNAYKQGDVKQAIRLFDEAALALPDPFARSARLNAGIARLRTAELKGVTLIQQIGGPQDKELEADLTLERALSNPSPLEARKAIEDFITQHPGHPRVAEARLAAAEAALTAPAIDLTFARSQLDTLNGKPETTGTFSPTRLALARLRIADISEDSASAIAIARSIMETYPADPMAADAALTLGRNLFETNDYNPARLVLEKLAASDSDPQRAQAAWLLAARSAALVGTLSSKEEALVLFDKAIALEGPLVSIARLEKADHLIKNMYRFADASAFLRKWFDSLPTTDALRLPAGLLLGQSLYAQGSTSPNTLIQALEIYDQLLPHAEKHPALIYRLQYLRGLALEQLPDDKNPTKKRGSQAFIAYYSVLETTTAPTEWEFFELCGFKALSLLEKAERWPAAIACAKKIASFKGPRAEEAATRANQLQLKHMIWED